MSIAWVAIVVLGAFVIAAGISEWQLRRDRRRDRRPGYIIGGPDG